MTTETTKAHDEAQIRQLIADQASAICARDLDRIMAPYAADVINFDVKPPFQTKGVDAWRQTWAACLPYFPDSAGTQTRDLRIFVSGDLVLAHWLWRLTGVDKDHPAAQMWMRSTAGYQRKQGRWQIVHEHCSVPFDPLTSKAVFTLEPSPIQWQEPKRLITSSAAQRRFPDCFSTNRHLRCALSGAGAASMPWDRPATLLLLSMSCPSPPASMSLQHAALSSCRTVGVMAPQPRTRVRMVLC